MLRHHELFGKMNFPYSPEPLVPIPYSKQDLKSSNYEVVYCNVPKMFRSGGLSTLQLKGIIAFSIFLKRGSLKIETGTDDFEYKNKCASAQRALL